jgi:hypothetical protein
MRYSIRGITMKYKLHCQPDENIADHPEQLDQNPPVDKRPVFVGRLRDDPDGFGMSRYPPEHQVYTV